MWAVVVVVVGTLAPSAAAQLPSQTDPRVGLDPGFQNAEEASWNLTRIGHAEKAPGFSDPTNPGAFGFLNSDLALQGDFAFVGSFNGIQIYDVSDPANPTVRTSIVCPGGQGDPSVYGDLLFMSVEESRARVDCGTNPAVGTRFQGVRVFDISNIDAPVQVAAVQTCRGSHTHTLVTDPDDPDNIYVYVSGTAGVRPASTMAGCLEAPATDPAASRWRIEVIKVPLAAPQDAAVVNEVRLFTDPNTGAIDGLQNAPPTPLHPSGIAWGPTPITDACHDITAYPEIGLAAGACEGNGLLIDISDAANPKRLDAVADPNYAYWHSATFNNDGTKVVFTDEWGGGTNARCRATDQLNWGADAIFDIVNGKLEFRSYYKLPVAQTNQENCVAHNGTIVPVRGKDVMVQGWYQGGLSVFDFTNSTSPKEIAYFDRGPVSGSALVFGGFWTSYYYNGLIYGTELARGIDVFRLDPSEFLSQADLDLAAQPQFDRLNAQLQERAVWYDWEGFLVTFENPPVLNETKSTNVQAFWFRLGGDRGLDVLKGTPQSRQIDCETKEPIGDFEPAETPGSSSLHYQQDTQRYSYSWKPPKGNDYAGTCREFVLTLSNGSQHSAWLHFVK
ncbi:MAG: PxKF domain-containing protein [Gaiellaceae bacterium]